MARVDEKALERAGQALNARIASGDWPGATREIIETYLDEAERSKAPEEAIERACIAYWGEHTFFRIFGEKSRRNIREAMRRAASAFATYYNNSVVVPPLNWSEHKALRGTKLLAFDPFGHEFARIDLYPNITVTEIETRKHSAEEEYQRKMWAAIYPPVPVVGEPR